MAGTDASVCSRCGEGWYDVADRVGSLCPECWYDDQINRQADEAIAAAEKAKEHAAERRADAKTRAKELAAK